MFTSVFSEDFYSAAVKHGSFVFIEQAQSFCDSVSRFPKYIFLPPHERSITKYFRFCKLFLRNFRLRNIRILFTGDVRFPYCFTLDLYPIRHVFLYRASGTLSLFPAKGGGRLIRNVEIQRIHKVKLSYAGCHVFYNVERQSCPLSRHYVFAHQRT